MCSQRNASSSLAATIKMKLRHQNGRPRVDWRIDCHIDQARQRLAPQDLGWTRSLHCIFLTALWLNSLSNSRSVKTKLSKPCRRRAGEFYEEANRDRSASHHLQVKAAQVIRSSSTIRTIDFLVSSSLSWSSFLRSPNSARVSNKEPMCMP
jgi:hypothetical protein